MLEIICISFAFVFGLAVRRVGLPPMLGFLAAGFAIAVAGPSLELPSETNGILKHISHLGVLLLLFGIGLKLRLGQIVQPQVLFGALIQSGVTTVILGCGLVVLLGLDWQTALLLGVALSFSSTVFSAKSLEAKRDLGTFYGRTAIGILVVQDIIALGVMAIWGTQSPSRWGFVLVFALPIIRPILHRLLDLAGHDELLVLAGLLLAIVIGGAGFEAVGLSSEIGALAAGLVLSTHRRAKELSDAIWSLKELFLVGFFLQIGLSGLPGLDDLVFAVVLTLLLPVKGVLFFAILLAFGLSARTAFLSAISLMAYSEFALILAAALLPEWLVPLALTVSLSFLVAAPLDRLAQQLFERFETRLTRFEPRFTHRTERPTDLGVARVLILGMGRTGTAAYDRLAQTTAVIGVDADEYLAAGHRKAGRNAIAADVEDAGFWRGVDLAGLEAVILAMDGIDAKVYAALAIRKKGFRGPIVSHALYEDHIARLMAAGVTQTWLTMTQAGMGLAEQTARILDLDLTPAAQISANSG